MKKTAIVLFVLFLIIINSCKIEENNNGLLYITDNTNSGAEIFNIKILQDSDNEVYARNVFPDYLRIIKYEEFVWYVYEIPSGSWEIYIEYYDKKGNFCNERQRVYITGNNKEREWAAIWLIDNSKEHSHSIWTEHGNGELNITNSMFNK